MDKLFTNKIKYFEIQYLNSKNSILPFISDQKDVRNGLHVLEIGSAEGGVLKAFTELGCICLGIELQDYRVEHANEFMKDEVTNGLIKFINKNIYDIDPSKLESKFDIIILKDVIEHIHDQGRFMKKIGEFLKDDGIIFYGFPAWCMPYGGHQQIADSKFLSKLPYYHLLPKFLYKGILKLFGEKEKRINGLLEIKETQISTKRFERLCKENNFVIIKKLKYLVAPIYEYKFGYKTKLLPKWIASIPFLNDFFTFQSYYIVKKS